MSNGETMANDLQDNLGNLAETVLDALKEKFMEAVVDALGSSFEPLSGAFEAFEALSGVCGGDLEGAIGGITDSIGQVTDLIEAIEPVTDVIKALL